MKGEYNELRISKKQLIYSIVFGIMALMILIGCLINSPEDNVPMIVVLGLTLIYCIYCCLEQVNWYLRYNYNGFEVRNFVKRTSYHSFDEIKSVKPLKKNAVIIYMKKGHRQYEIEPGVKGVEDFLERFIDYCNTDKEE